MDQEPNDITDDAEESFADWTISTNVCHNVMLVNRVLSTTLLAVLVIFPDEDALDIGDFSVNPNARKYNRLNNLIEGHLSLFKVNTGFFPSEFEQLSQLVCPIMLSRARHSNAPRNSLGRPTKLSAEERLLSCVIYVHHSNGVRTDAANWNASRTSLRDDAMSVCSVINEVLEYEIAWPNPAKRSVLRNRIPQLPDCIGSVDGTLCRIKSPTCAEPRAYYNGRKKVYCFNSTVVFEHDRLFRLVAPCYGGSFHHVRISCDTDLARNWQQYFTGEPNNQHPVEKLLGDPGYLGMDHFTLWRIDEREFENIDSDPVLRAFNCMHSGFRVAVEWGIGGFKQKCARFQAV